MAAHLKRRGSIYYLVDGATRISLKTDKKGLAQYRLTEYMRGKYGLIPTPAVEEFYNRWIDGKVEPLCRRSLVHDYRYHFRKYILPAFKDTRLGAITTRDLNDFRISLLKHGLAVKSARNILGGTFRAMYRDARLEIEALQGKDPFIDIQWPRMPRQMPDPFTTEKRDRIIAWYVQNDFFYYPIVAWQFFSGMRPSETFALTWRDVDLVAGTVSINKSRNMNTVAATKTANSERIIPLDERLIGILKLLPSRELGLESVFVNKHGTPMSASWAENCWREPLKKMSIRHRKFYATRHTLITTMVEAGHNLKRIADFTGTSVAMIEQNYCARMGLTRTESAQSAEKTLENVDQRSVQYPGLKISTP